MAIQDLDGNVNYAFSTTPYRIVDVAVAPDSSRLVCLGEASHVPRGNAQGSTGSSANGTHPEPTKTLFEVKDRRIIVFNLHERRQERFGGVFT